EKTRNTRQNRRSSFGRLKSERSGLVPLLMPLVSRVAPVVPRVPAIRAGVSAITVELAGVFPLFGAVALELFLVLAKLGAIGLRRRAIAVRLVRGELRLVR